MNTLMKTGNGSMPATTFSGLVDRLFHNNVNRVFDDVFWGFNGVAQNVNPPVNIRETDKSYELQLVAPGLKKEDFKVSISGDALTINFEHKEEHIKENKEDGWLRKEYQRRSFVRSFSLDDSINANGIAAKYADGILQLTIPKKDGASTMSRTINIE